MTKQEELRQVITVLQDRMSQPGGIIEQRRAAQRQDPNGEAFKILVQVTKDYEDHINGMLFQIWELNDQDAASARAEADKMAQHAVERDIDGIKLLKDLGYEGVEENVIGALCDLRENGYRITMGNW